MVGILTLFYHLHARKVWAKAVIKCLRKSHNLGSFTEGQIRESWVVKVKYKNISLGERSMLNGILCVDGSGIRVYSVEDENSKEHSPVVDRTQAASRWKEKTLLQTEAQEKAEVEVWKRKLCHSRQRQHNSRVKNKIDPRQVVDRTLAKLFKTETARLRRSRRGW